jgi:hypothetical protein
MDILWILAAPIVITGAIAYGMTIASRRSQLALLLAAYVLINFPGVFVFGLHRMPSARDDTVELLFLITLVLLTRAIDRWAFGLGYIFHLKWRLASRQRARPTG